MKELPSHVLKTTMNQKIEEPNKTNDGPPDGPIASDAQQKDIETEQKEIDTAVKVAPAAEMPAETKEMEDSSSTTKEKWTFKKLYFQLIKHTNMHMIEFGSLSVCAFTLWSGLVFFLNDQKPRFSGPYLVLGSVVVATVNIGFIVLLGLKFVAAVLKERHTRKTIEVWAVHAFADLRKHANHFESMKNKEWKGLAKQVHKLIHHKKRKVAVQPVVAEETERKLTEAEKSDAFWGLLDDGNEEEKGQLQQRTPSFMKKIEREVNAIESVHAEHQDAKIKEIERRHQASRQRLKQRLSVQQTALKKVKESIVSQETKVESVASTSENLVRVGSTNFDSKKVAVLQTQVAAKVLTYNRWSRIFKKFDKDSSGAMSIEEFARLCKCVDNNVETSTVKGMWKGCWELKEPSFTDTEMDVDTMWKYLVPSLPKGDV
jgi:hypothetical protein